jgi:hypothetical protein
MRDNLAERLLAKVMGWTPEDVTRERPILQAMAAYKYDEYHQFSPGMRFVESLALWLDQFKVAAQKRVAYDFVKTRLVFISAAELGHLVSMAYPDFVRPHLLRQLAREKGICAWHVGKVAGSTAFKIRQRQCLFLGLSDGARTDIFRRYNNDAVTHEQVLLSHEISPGRVPKLIDELNKDLVPLFGGTVPPEECRFRTIVLLDDFSASGISYLRREEDGNYKGKIWAFHAEITDPTKPASQLVDLSRTQILVILYVGTDQARRHLEKQLEELWKPLRIDYRVILVHTLDSGICLAPGCQDSMEPLLEGYYDREIEDEHTRKGGKDLKFGFAGCGLPVVLSHNTPNNSIYLLWAEKNALRALFPRVQRHRKQA